VLGFLLAKISTNMRVEDGLDGEDNFKSWKHRIQLIIEDNELLDHVKKMLLEPEDEEAKTKFKKNEVKAKRILTDSITDHLIPNVSELKTAKEMFDALTRFYESKNTNEKLTLQHQVRNVTMNKSEDTELVSTTINGFPPSWDPFVQGICARRRLPKFDKLWSDCTQEQSRLISKTQKTNEEENQALAAQVKKRKKIEEGSPKKSKRPCYKKDASKVRCYSCQKLGHYSFQCSYINEKEKKKHHAHAIDAEEHSKASKDKEFVF
jgi:hypothetical protein